MSGLLFDPEWLGRTLDYQEETATFAALKVVVRGCILTRSFSPRLGTQRERVNVPTYPLALGIAREWWPLLHETERGVPGEGEHFWDRHRLDAFLRGFLFPPLALWSTGAEAVAAASPQNEDPAGTAPIEFRDRVAQPRAFVPRFEAEAALSDLVEATLARPGLAGGPADLLREAWDRVLASLADPVERAYCEAAGRLGLDPYDPDSPDLTLLAAPLSEALFASLCEASTVEELAPAVEFADAQVARLHGAPVVEVGAFGTPPPGDLGRRAAFDGYEAARKLRATISLGDDPRVALRRLLGDAAERDPIQMATRVRPIEGVVGRKAGRMRAAIVGARRSQHRFRLCRAAYVAWMAPDDSETAITVARTRVQQASRSFAAELIAPAEFLRERAGSHGFTSDDIGELAAELECDPQIIRDQAANHDIALRGGAEAS